MDSDLRRHMLAYDNERATEYEEGLYLGTGTSSITDGSVFTTEAALLTHVAGRFGQGRLLDLACGTGFWLPYYAPRCSHMTFFDQSERMLAECRKKAEQLGIVSRCFFVQGDLLDREVLPKADFDSALVGFLPSHIPEAEVERFRLTIQIEHVGAGAMCHHWSDSQAAPSKASTLPRRVSRGAPGLGRREPPSHEAG